MISVREVQSNEKKLINEIVSIHLNTFEGFFLTFMGRGFLNQMYKSYCDYEYAGLLVAEDGNKTLGFLAYSSNFSGLYKYMIKTKIIPFAWYSIGAFFRKPSAFMHIIKAFLKPGEAKRKERYVELASIGVDPNRPLFVKKIKDALKVPVYLHMHNDALVGKKREAKAIEKCSKILAVSNYIESCIKKNYPKAKISVVYNGISVQKFLPNNNIREKEKIREKYGIAEKDIVICFAGRFVESKGVLELVRSYSKLQYFANVKLVIMGSSWYGVSTTNPYIEKVKREAKKCKNKIIFTGYLSNNKVAELEAVADIAVLPSMWEEPLGLSILEAMASGLAVISTKSGGIKEIIKENSGILLNRDDKMLDNMTFYLEKLILNDEYRKMLGKNARKRVEECFTEEKYYKCFRKELNEQ